MSEILLTITFGSLQVEPRVLLCHRCSPMPCSASVTNKHIAHKCKEYHVDQRRCHQNSHGKHWLVPRPRNATKNGCSRHKRQTQRGWKILLTPQIFTSANATPSQVFTRKVTVTLVASPFAFIAPHRRIGRNGRSDSPLLASGALENNMSSHGGVSCESGPERIQRNNSPRRLWTEKAAVGNDNRRFSFFGTRFRCETSLHYTRSTAADGLPRISPEFGISAGCVSWLMRSPARLRERVLQTQYGIRSARSSSAAVISPIKTRIRPAKRTPVAD